MKHLLGAIRFLTILPIGKRDEFHPRSMITCFPLVGLVIGILLALCDILFLKLWPKPVSALLDVILLVVLTGAFHIDGLGDSADGLYGRRSRENALTIMKDSRIGTMALSTIVCTLAVKWAGLAGIMEGRFIFLLIIPAYARTTSLFGFCFLPYGRPDGGTGHAFFKDPVTLKAFRYFTLPLILSLFTGWRGILLNLVFGFTLILILGYYRKKLGCITGDMLGAMVEITEAVLFLVVSIGGDL
jgi:adenosylcobinamide-GDP ribazoletransferase